MSAPNIYDFYSEVTGVWEKGKVNHPDDPGGATNDGVATHFITDFASNPSGVEFLRSIGIEPCFVKGYANKKATSKTTIFDPDLLMSFTPDQCRDILIEAFWTRNRLGELSCFLSAFATFDFCVNSGSSRGKKSLQRAANSYESHNAPLVEDGKLGPLSFSRLQEFATPQGDYALANTVCDIRERFLRNLSTFKTFGRGWMNRVNSIRAYLDSNYQN